MHFVMILSTYPMTFGTSVYRKKKLINNALISFPYSEIVLNIYLYLRIIHVILQKSFSKMNVHKLPRTQELKRHSLIANENDILKILQFTYVLEKCFQEIKQSKCLNCNFYHLCQNKLNFYLTYFLLQKTLLGPQN